MAEPQKGSKKKSKTAPEGNPLRDWIIRGVVIVVLAILLTMAGMDFRVKQNATTTAEAWRVALRSKGENSDLVKSEFAKIPVIGSPTVTSFTEPVKKTLANTIDTYTWKGTFRSYVVKVSFGLGGDPPVDLIEGP